jgi:hypothetical protein
VFLYPWLNDASAYLMGHKFVQRTAAG